MIQKTTIGIDPGKSGGVAVLSGAGVTAYSMPVTDGDLVQLLREHSIPGKTVAFVEKVSSSPQMGVVSAFKFGRSVGAIGMACVALGIRMELVTPQSWQKSFGLIVKGRGLGQGDTEKKNRNKARAQELFPGLKITHATADCLLIAEYGRRISTAASTLQPADEEVGR